MEYQVSDPQSWLTLGEQDFCYGAKTASYLPSAITPDAPSNHTSFDLPEWMESRENLGLSKIELFDDVTLSHNLGDNIGSQVVDPLCDMKEMYVVSTQPEGFSSLFAGSALSRKSEINTVYHGVDAGNVTGQCTLAPQPEDSKFQILNTIDGSDEDYGLVINPDDMLVPLSELQPINEDVGAVIRPDDMLMAFSKFQSETQNSPQGLAANPMSSSIVLPKIIVTKKVIAPLKSNSKCSHPAHQSQVLSVLSNAAANANVQSVELAPCAAIPVATASSDVDNLISEAVEMIGNKSEEEYIMNSSMDSGMFVDEMDDLLSQLESIKYPQLGASDVSSWGSEPVSPASLPSPVPSAGSLSPQSVGDYLYPSSVQSSDDTEKNTLSVPCDGDVYITSVNSPAGSVGNCDEGHQSTIHTYSSTPGKSKASRKKNSSSRGAQSREIRRERKKEQNKQAALRYRHKKKEEDGELMDQIRAEEERQEQLKSKYTNLKQELTYLKKIMREVFIAKGVVSADAFKKK